MLQTRIYLLQLWQDQSGPWAVLKDEQSGQLHQFESLEALTLFLSQLGQTPPEPPSTKEIGSRPLA
jgi:hypothetical protein